MAAGAATPSIRLTVPGTLAHRGVAVRVVAEACRLVSGHGQPPPVEVDRGYDLRHPFDAAVVSAFAEIFNNIVIHAYGAGAAGSIELAIATSADDVVIDIHDHGAPFDLAAVPSPELDALPEGGMGIHIARTMLDDVAYAPGPPNRWRLSKALRPPEVTP
ncbi:MAG: ATP-binding protein [Kofleriaceae bacterium]